MTIAEFEALLDQNTPADPDARRVYADWLDEQGDHALAKAQRWMADNDKAPLHGPDRSNDAGWWPIPWYRKTAHACELPASVFYLLKGGTTRIIGRIYGSAAEAERALADALAIENPMPIVLRARHNHDVQMARWIHGDR